MGRAIDGVDVNHGKLWNVVGEASEMHHPLAHPSVLVRTVTNLITAHER